MKFDYILTHHLGECGRYQKIQFILVSIPTIFTALHSLSWTFTAAKMKYRCLYPGENGTALYKPNDTWHTWLANVTHIDACKRVSNLSAQDYTLPLHYTTESCKSAGYAWDRSKVTESAVSRWAIVCADGWIRSFVQSMYYIGQFFGSFIFGFLSDKVGRKPVFFVAILLQVICGAAMAVVPHWGIFAVLRIGVGFAHPGIFVMAVVIGAELVAPRYRVVSSVAAGFFFSMGEIILGALAFPLTDYRYLQLTISLPAVLFFTYWWLVPESPRWLMSRHRFEQADKVLQRVAACNRRPPLPPNWYENLQTEQKAPIGFFDAFASLFRTPNIRKRTLIVFVLWPVVSMCYYGLAMNPSFMGGDDRLGFIVGGALEIPGLLVVLFALNILGRKLLTSLGFLLAAICLLCTLAVPASMPLTSMILVIIGKSALTAVYAVVYIMTPELYPTVIRNTATGACSMIARAGGVAASYMSLHVAEKSPAAVAITFAVLSFVAAMSVMFLPETTGEPMLETIDEAETFGADQRLFILGYQNKRAVDAKVTANAG